MWQGPCEGGGLGGGSPQALPARPLGRSRSVSRWTTSTCFPPSSLSGPVTPAHHFGVGTQEPDGACLPCDMPRGARGVSGDDHCPCPRLRAPAVQAGRPAPRGQRLSSGQRHRPLRGPPEGPGLNPSAWQLPTAVWEVRSPRKTGVHSCSSAQSRRLPWWKEFFSPWAWQGTQ